MFSPKIIIIGSGIAGPVLAILLKQKGYYPVLFDRLDGVVEAGISLAYVSVGISVRCRTNCISYDIAYNLMVLRC